MLLVLIVCCLAVFVTKYIISCVKRKHLPCFLRFYTGLSNAVRRKGRICGTLRFLLGPCIYYPPFAKTRLRLRQFARWRKLARTSFRKPRDRHFIPAFHPDSFFQSLAILTIIERNLFHSPRILPCTLKVWTKEKFQNCIWQMEELIFGFVTVENLRAS